MRYVLDIEQGLLILILGQLAHIKVILHTKNL